MAYNKYAKNTFNSGWIPVRYVGELSMQKNSFILSSFYVKNATFPPYLFLCLNFSGFFFQI